MALFLVRQAARVRVAGQESLHPAAPRLGRKGHECNEGPGTVVGDRLPKKSAFI